MEARDDLKLELNGVEDVAEGEVTAFEVGGQVVAVARYEGRLYAFEDQCSHQECALSTGFVEDGQIECECHGAMFDLATGAVTLPPAIDPIRTFPLEEADGKVFIRLGEFDASPVGPADLDQQGKYGGRQS